MANVERANFLTRLRLDQKGRTITSLVKESFVAVEAKRHRGHMTCSSIDGTRVWSNQDASKRLADLSRYWAVSTFLRSQAGAEV